MQNRREFIKKAAFLSGAAGVFGACLALLIANVVRLTRGSAPVEP